VKKHFRPNETERIPRQEEHRKIRPRTTPSAITQHGLGTAVWLGAVLLATITAPAVQVQQLTGDNNYDALSWLDNGQVVWLTDTDWDYDPDTVVFYDGTNAVTLSTDTGDPAWGAMSDNGQVVWQERHGSNVHVRLYRNGAITNLASYYAKYYSDSPWISDGQVVWSDFTNYVDNGTEYYYPNSLIFFNGTETVTVATGGGPGAARVSHGKIVWRQWADETRQEDIFLYRNGTVTNLSNQPGSDQWPQISDDQVVWGCDTNRDDFQPDQLFLYDGAQTIMLAGEGRPRDAVLDRGQVVWVQGEGVDAEIYLYRNGVVTNLSNNGVRDEEPWISDGQVTWRSDLNGDGYMESRWFFDGTSSYLVDDWGWGWNGRLNHGKAAWESWAGNSVEIFLVNLIVPALQVSPEGHNFGYVLVGQAVTQQFSVVNAGSADLTIGAIALSDGPNVGSFAIRNDHCSGQTLAPGDMGTFDAVFAPTSLWGKAVSVVIPSNDPDAPTNRVPLYGTGIDSSTAEQKFQEGLVFFRNYQSTNAPAHDTNNLFAAEQRFLQALAANPNHYGAGFLESITRLLTTFYDPEVSQMLTSYGMPLAGRDLLDWTAEFPAVLPTNAPTSGQAFALAYRKLVPVFDNLITNLSRIPTNWTGSLIVGPSDFPIDNEVEVDAGDMQMIQAGAGAYKALLQILNGFNMDFNFAYLDHVDTPRKTIMVDGNTNDWAGVEPLLVDPADAVGVSSNDDLYRVSTAMDATKAYILVETYGKPIDPNATIEMNVNFKPGRQWDDGAYDDLHLNITPGGLLAWTNSLTNMTVYPVSGYTIARGTALEVCIPLLQLGNPGHFAATFVNIFTNGALVGCDPSEVPPPSLSAYLAQFPAFGTLTNAASIAAATGALTRALDNYLVGAALIKAETDYQADDLIVFDPQDAGEQEHTRVWVAQIKDSLNRRVAAPFAPELSQFLDLHYCFTNPVSLRAFLTGGGVQQVLLNHGRYQIDFALSHLAGVNTNFNQILQYTNSPFANQPTEADYGDVGMARTWLTAIKMAIDVLGAYDTDCNLVKLMEAGHTRIADFTNTYPRFLMITNLANLTAASNLVAQAVSNYVAASQFILPDGSRLYNLFALDPIDGPRARTFLEGIRDSMTGTVLIANGDVYEYVHASRFFAPNYVTRAHLPNFRDDNTAIEGTFPDPTFNGVLPSNTQWAVSRMLNLPHADTDADGMPDLWETTLLGGTLTNAPNGDRDGDGLSNYAEYLAGTHPNNNRSIFKLELPGTPQAGGPTVRWQSQPYRYYQLYRATNLLQGFSLLEPLIQSTPPTNVYSDVSAGSGRQFFYRGGVSPAP
jgi:hypothetical protein